MSFADLKVSDDLSMYNSSRQNMLVSENGQTVNEDWLPKSRITSFKYMTGLFRYFKTILAGIFLPILLSPLLMSGRDEYKCIWCVLVMSIYWVGEIIPLAATALFPLFLFPLTGLMTPKAVAKEYMNDTNFLFIGGLIVAAAVEKSDLHERIALRVLTLSGSQPKWVMLGFMSVTALLSMFISNTATCAMLVPVCQSVIDQLEESYAAHHKASTANLMESSPKKDFNKSASAMSKGMIISICFAANIGGTATVTGTPPNLVLVGQLANLYPGANTGVHYMSYFFFAFPLMVLCLLTCWAILVFYFMRHAPEGNDAVTKMMHNRYTKLPPMSYAEKSVGVVFIIMLLMWLFRAPEIIPGFGDLFEKGWFTDATSSMIVVALLFILPAEKPKLGWPTAEDLAVKKQAVTTGVDSNGEPITKLKEVKPPRLMDWDSMIAMFPWGIVWLLGGGFALAAGVKESGLSDMLGTILAQLESLPMWTIQFVCVVAVMVVTNICSNTVTASIFIPIAATLAEKTEVHPLNMMLPTTMACSLAFMLPVGTPPNAIVFSSGMLKVTDMIISGFFISIATMLITIAYMQSFAYGIFDLDTFPEWARISGGNATGF